MPDPARVKEVFLAASDKQGAERAAYLDEACGADIEMRRRVEALLAAHDEAGSFLEHPPEGATAAVETGRRGVHVPEEAGTRIGVYKLLQQIGEGGMGTVWMAEQQEPVRRMVALKVIKAGLASAQVIARFEAERQALALMDHPNIARVLDAGTTQNGRPYFVMELVKGVPITQFCDEKKLTPKERLELFVPVCQAVQHAHQKGIIHRDLKPSNVMVALYDGRPVPKVIDFGVAKATGQKLTDKTLFTGFGAVVGTLEYMSPEQAELNQLDIDTRSDVYSLGVLLYELLTGSTPLDRKRLREGALLEMLRIIREEEPPKPSARLSSSETLPNVAASRGTEPGRLTRLVRGELDWIVMKALEKDRARRYETANGLGRDIQRYLADEAVEACPPSATYRLRKFLRKNRTMLSTVGAFVGVVLVALILGLVAVGLEQRQTARARDDALDAEHEANDHLEQARANLKRARAAEKEAKGNLAQAEVNLKLAKKAVTETFDLAKTHPLLRQETMRAVRKLLFEKALPFYKNFQAQTPDDPKSQRALAGQLFAVGLITHEIGDKNEAIRAFERARDSYQALLRTHPQDIHYRKGLASALHNLALLLRDTGKRTEALKVYRQTRAIEEKLVKDAPGFTKAREDLATTLTSLGNLLKEERKNAEALAAYKQARKIREKMVEDFPDVPLYRDQQARVLGNIGIVLIAEDRRSEAMKVFATVEAIYQKLVKQYPKVTEYRHYLAQTLTHIGQILNTDGKTTAGLAAYKRARAIGEKLVEQHPEVTAYRRALANTLSVLGRQLIWQGEPAEGWQALTKARDMGRQLVKAHPDVDLYRCDLAQVLISLGDEFQRQGKYAEARKTYTEARGLFEKLAKELSEVSTYREGLAGALVGLGNTLLYEFKFAEALKPLTRARDIQRQLVKAAPRVTKYRSTLAQTCWLRGIACEAGKRHKEALADLTESIDQGEAILKIDPRNKLAPVLIGNACAYRAFTLVAMKRYREALPDYERAIKLLTPAFQYLWRKGRADCLARAGDYRRAMSEAALLARVTRIGRDWFSLTCTAALASAGALTDATHPLAWRERFGEKAARQAVAWLWEADKAGYFKNPAFRKSLLTVPDLAGLRQRDDFKRFIEQRTP